MFIIQFFMLYYLWRLGFRRMVGLFVLIELINVVWVFIEGGRVGWANIVLEIVISSVMVIVIGESALRGRGKVIMKGSEEEKFGEKVKERKEGGTDSVIGKVFTLPVNKIGKISDRFFDKR